MARFAAFNVRSCMVVAVLATIFVMQSTDAFRQMSTSKKSTRFANLNMAADGKENSMMDILSGTYPKPIGQEMIWWISIYFLKNLITYLRFKPILPAIIRVNCDTVMLRRRLISSDAIPSPMFLHPINYQVSIPFPIPVPIRTSYLAYYLPIRSTRCDNI